MHHESRAQVRGAAKAASQEKNAKAAASAQKSGSQLKAREAAYNTECLICKSRMPTVQNLKDHHLSKHGATPVPAWIAEALVAQAAKKAEDSKKKVAGIPPAGGAGVPKPKKNQDLSFLNESLGTGAKKK